MYPAGLHHHPNQPPYQQQHLATTTTVVPISPPFPPPQLVRVAALAQQQQANALDPNLFVQLRHGQPRSPLRISGQANFSGQQCYGHFAPPSAAFYASAKEIDLAMGMAAGQIPHHHPHQHQPILIPVPAAMPPGPAHSDNIRVPPPPPPPATKAPNQKSPAPAEINMAAGDCWSTAVTGWEQAAIIKNKIGLVINGRFRILQSIASGSYGEIFAAEDLQSGGAKKQRVAVKFDGACRDNHLRYEYQVYKSALYEDGNGRVEGFPQVHWYGHEYGHNIMVMELLGAPVASLFAFCDRKFARQTIISLGEQMVHRIRHLHQRGFIHRDIKPENFLMGLAGKESNLYLIDFGLARRYRFRENRALTHIPFRRGRNFIGTAKYASLNSHKNIELSRRDDLESLAYVLIELINGQLPWKNISKRNATTRHQASIRIRTLKEQTNWEEFCPPMAKFIRYCREIPFNEEPDYDRLLELLKLIAVPEGFQTMITNSKLLSPNRNTRKTDKMVSTTLPHSSHRAICCQTAETAEKMTQVDFESREGNGRVKDEDKLQPVQTAEEEHVAGEETESVSITRVVQSTMQRLSLTVAENNNNSDFDEAGAATTTTSCSENELESAAGGEVEQKDAVRTDELAVSDGDDELTADSQQTSQQQEQQQVCRKCRRLRDQTQQKRQQQQHLHRPLQVVQQQQQKQMPPQPLLGGTMEQHFPLATTAESSPRKMCWQRARDSNPERRFQYENRFSWTVPHGAPVADPAQQQQQHQQAQVVQQLQQAPPQLRAGAGLPILIPAAALPPQHLFPPQQHPPQQPQFVAQQSLPLFNGVQMNRPPPIGVVPSVAIPPNPALDQRRVVAGPASLPLLPTPATQIVRQQIVPPSLFSVAAQHSLQQIGTGAHSNIGNQPPPPQPLLFHHPPPPNHPPITIFTQSPQQQQQPQPAKRQRRPLQIAFVVPPEANGNGGMNKEMPGPEIGRDGPKEQ